MGNSIRRLRLNGVCNVRDLGGYETRDGGMTRWNTLYRAGNLSGADAGDWKKLWDAGVRTILDLRSSSEIRMFPTRLPEGMNRYHTPLQAEDIDLGNLVESAGKAFAKSLQDGYVDMAGNHTEKLAACLERMTECLEQGAVLFHCSAGKDRTGVAASAVLWLCGVDRADIVADYEVSCTYNQQGFNAQLKKLPDSEAFAHLFRSEPGNMEQLLDFYESWGLEEQLAEAGFSRAKQRRLVALVSARES